MELGKVIKRGEDLYFVKFFFCFSLFSNLFWSTKMGIFYREKAFHARKKKIRKTDFAPSEKYACYAPV